MSPVGGESGNREANLIADLIIWNRQTQLGVVFSSSTIFNLPKGGNRSPDVAWVSLARWEKLTPAEKEGFPPPFVLISSLNYAQKAIASSPYKTKC
ncbi:MAG: Uma2 family endonuclease [Snowella sp.]